MYLRDTFAEKPLPMKDFDPQAHIRVLQQVRDGLSDPRRRQIMTNFIDHASAEGRGDYEALMATCSRKRQSYHYWGSGEGIATSNLPQSYAELEVYYRGLIDSKTWMLQIEVDKVIVGDDEALMDGVLHQLYPTELIEPLFQIAVDTRYRAYQLTKRLCTIFIFDEDGLGCGEHAYSNGPIVEADLTPVEDEYLPELFRR